MALRRLERLDAEGIVNSLRQLGTNPWNRLEQGRRIEAPAEPVELRPTAGYLQPLRGLSGAPMTATDYGR